LSPANVMILVEDGQFIRFHATEDTESTEDLRTIKMEIWQGKDIIEKDSYYFLLCGLCELCG